MHDSFNSTPDAPSLHPTLSVVIASRDRQDLLRACLQSVRQCSWAPHEIIVVDSASFDPDATARVAIELGARFVRTDMPGAAYARNLGVVAARGEIVAFTDDDAVVDPGWVEAITAAFADPSLDAVVGPVFVRGTDPTTAMSVNAEINPSKDKAHFCRTDPSWFERLALGSIGFGANLSVRRTTFHQHGLFRNCLGAGAPIPGDENYFLLCLVMRGGLVVNEPRARVTHPPQPPARIQALRRARLAQVIYLLSAQPQLFPKIMMRMMRRFLPNSRIDSAPGRRPDPWTLAELASIIVATPGLLLEAWQIERRIAKAASMVNRP